METQTIKNKILGNLSTEVHKRINIIKASYSLPSADETLKFILETFDKAIEKQDEEYLEVNKDG